MKITKDIITDDGSFRIGYNNGEGPAGTDFSYVYFSADFEREDEVVHEIY
ncbi:MAG: hypothetical protein LUH15_14920 [Tannerellaceae bacterium]|nr:hypothetical protein [Tannerellaceae bacterium]